MKGGNKILLKTYNFPKAKLTNSEMKEFSGKELKIPICRIIDKVKIETSKQIRKGISKKLNEFREDVNKQINDSVNK